MILLLLWEVVGEIPSQLLHQSSSLFLVCNVFEQIVIGIDFIVRSSVN